MLAMLCIIALLSNVLAVGLGALFNEDQTTAIYTSTFTPNIAPQFDNQSVFDLQRYYSLRTIATGLYQDEAYIAMANYTSGTQLPPWTTPDYFFQPYTVDSGGQSNSSSTYRIPTRGFGASMNCTAVPQRTVALSYPASLASVCSTNTITQLEVAEMVFRTSETTRPAGQSAIEYSDTLQAKSFFDDCSRPMTFGWGRTPQALDMNATVEASFAICQIFFQTAMFDVRHDAEGNVLEYERTSNLSTHLDGDDGDVQTNRMIINMNALIRAYGRAWHNDTLSRDWMNYLLTTTLGTRDFLDPSKPVPDPNDLIPTIEKVYRQLFAIFLGLNQQLFVPGDKEASVTGQKLTEETRIFMDQNAFIITVTVISLNIIAVVIFYSHGIIFNLPRVPTTIGSVLAFVSASHILEDQGPSPRNPGGKLNEKKTYSFGRYIGVDQKVHLGIDMDPYVALIDPASLKEKKSLIQRAATGDLRKRKGTFEPVRNGTWL